MTLYGVLEYDIDRETALKYPELYRLGQENSLFGKRALVEWGLRSFWQAAVVFVLPLISLGYFAVEAEHGMVLEEAQFKEINRHTPSSTCRSFFLPVKPFQIVCSVMLFSLSTCGLLAVVYSVSR